MLALPSLRESSSGPSRAPLVVDSDVPAAPEPRLTVDADVLRAVLGLPIYRPQLCVGVVNRMSLCRCRITLDHPLLCPCHPILWGLCVFPLSDTLCVDRFLSCGHLDRMPLPGCWLHRPR